MREIMEVLKKLLNQIRNIYRYFFDLFDAMQIKDILNDADIDYIKEHNRKDDIETKSES